VRWDRAASISGLLEFAGALLALFGWYSHAMTAWVGNGVATALGGSLGPEIRPQDIGAVALTVWATHPLTWLLGLFCMEGAVRLCAAAFSETSLGIFPLFLFDKMFLSIFRKKPMRESRASEANRVGSFLGAIRERAVAASSPVVSDELCFRGSGTEEFLDICASRRKQDWNPPRVVRYLNDYYRLESGGLGGGSRPFHYTLRRLSVGVPGRTVLLYSPLDAVIKNQR
jgi:hypothetical protein